MTGAIIRMTGVELKAQDLKMIYRYILPWLKPKNIKISVFPICFNLKDKKSHNNVAALIINRIYYLFKIIRLVIID